MPEHPCLELVSNSEEKLQTHVSRRLVTMRKVKEYDSTYDFGLIVICRKQKEYKQYCRESIERNHISYQNLKEFVGILVVVHFRCIQRRSDLVESLCCLFSFHIPIIQFYLQYD